MELDYHCMENWCLSQILLAAAAVVATLVQFLVALSCELIYRKIRLNYLCMYVSYWRYSQFQNEYSMEQILKSPSVHEYLTKLQCWYCMLSFNIPLTCIHSYTIPIQRPFLGEHWLTSSVLDPKMLLMQNFVCLDTLADRESLFVSLLCIPWLIAEGT